MAAAVGEAAEAPSSAEDAAPFWARMEAASIPSKPALHEAFLGELEAVAAACTDRRGRVLDLGCGDGRLTAELSARFPTLDFLGVDVNKAAVAVARARSVEAESEAQAEARRRRTSEQGSHCAGEPSLMFHVGDVTEVGEEISGDFDLVLVQLVISVVGGVDRRRKLLRVARQRLRPEGRVLLSASGASEDINEQYAELYRKDEPLTGEFRTYLSRGADGQVLYPTHHFTEDELSNLFSAEGLRICRLDREREASSRRPDQAAWFFYAVAGRAEASGETEDT